MHFAIITGGGIGRRMNSANPKQFFPIHDKPIIAHTIEKFLAFDNKCKIILTLPEDYFDRWSDIKDEFFQSQNIQVVSGGDTRFRSIKNALDSIEEKEGIVAIHDAVRPCVTVDVIARSFESAKEKGSGVAAIQLRDSIREMDLEGSKSRDRNNYRLMQTPQTFDLKKIKVAYEQAGEESFTDDAAVWENAKNHVNLIEGSPQNIKITFPEDLLFAESILKSQSDSKTDR